MPVGVDMARDERGRVRVFAITKGLSPGVSEFNSIGPGVPIEDACHRVVMGDVRVKARSRRFGGWGEGAALVVDPVRGTTGRAWVGTGGGAVVVLCEKSQMDTSIGESALSIVGTVGRVATLQ